MMPKKRTILPVLIALTPLLLAACNMPAPSAPTPFAQSDAVYTAAAETIVAQLTEIAVTATKGPTSAAALPAATRNAAGEPEVVQDLFPTHTPQPTPTHTQTATPEISATPTVDPTATETPAPTPTLAPGDPKAELGSPNWVDTFDTSEGWPLNGVYEDEHASMTIKDGALVMTALKTEKWDSWILAWPELEDFYLEVAAKPGRCSGQDRYGLVARAPEVDQTYLFGVTCDGQYSLRRWNGERNTYLVEWTTSEHIHQGKDQVNRLGITAYGSRLSLYANGHLLAQVVDGTYTEGKFGVFVGSAETEGFKVRFTDAAYWLLY